MSAFEKEPLPVACGDCPSPSGEGLGARARGPSPLGEGQRRRRGERFLPALLLLLAPALAAAQEAGGYSAGPSEAPPYETRVQSFRPSPEATQQRLFASTRVWRLDPGQYEFEAWWRTRRTTEGTELLLQAEVEIGLSSHLQLDIYENLQRLPGGNLEHEGNQIELRYSFASEYGAIWGNPTLYLEWHPRHGAPDRAEGRLLLGGAPFGNLMAAANLFYEQNVETGTSEGTDTELGVSAAASYGLLGGMLRLGAETKLGADQHGGPDLLPVVQLGPQALFRLSHFTATATGLFGLAHDDPSLEAFLILGYRL